MNGLFVLGLTGPSGAGKTLASGVFRENGFFVLNADEAAHAVMAAGTPCAKELADAFGKEILLPNGAPDRRRIAAAVFADPSALRTLERIVHPHVLRLAEQELEAFRRQGGRFALFDAPALYQSGGERLCDKVLAVTAPREVCLSRILARDPITRAEAERRFDAVPADYFTRRADYILENSGNAAAFLTKLRAFAEAVKRGGEPEPGGFAR